jgi:hypothetical protein
MRVEEHLMECEPCTARELHRVAQVLDWWTAISHGAAARAEAFAASSIREVVARGIRGTQERVHDPALGERLARWARRWEEQAQAAVRVVVEGPGTASRVVVEGLDALTRPASSRQLTPAVAPTRGTLGAPEPTELTLALGPGAPRARIEVSGDRGDIVVRLEPLPRGQKLPLVLLVDAQSDAPPRVDGPATSPACPTHSSIFSAWFQASRSSRSSPGPGGSRRPRPFSACPRSSDWLCSRI